MADISKITVGSTTYNLKDTGASRTDTKNTVGATSASTQRYYPVGVLSGGIGQTYAQSYYDPYFYVEDGYVTADKLTSNGDVIAKGKIYVGGTTAYISYNLTTGAIEFNN